MRRFDVQQELEGRKLRSRELTPGQVKEINEYLDSIGEYGEIHLVVQHGELRFINTVASHKAVMTDHCQEKEDYET